MLSQILSHFRTRELRRQNPKAQRVSLTLEALEGRDVPATLLALDTANTLLRFDSSSPTAIQSAISISGVPSGERVVGMDFRPRTGQLYALTVDASGTGSTARLYTLDSLTGAASRVGTGSITVKADSRAAYGIDFNPTVDAIRVVNSADENLRLNPDTGVRADTPTNDTDLNDPGQQVNGVAYDRNFDGRLGAFGTTLYTINTTTGMLQTVGGLNQAPSPNSGILINVGPLVATRDADSFVGFDIGPAGAAQQGEAFAVFDGDAGAAVATGLYRINLASGAATRIGLVGNGTTRLTGLTVVPAGAVVVGSGQGANGDVRVLDPQTGALRVAVVPFAAFQGGVRVAAGDINRDSVPDIVVSAIAPQGHVRVFDGATGQPLLGALGSFFAFEGFTGTVNVTTGDINGDGYADVLVVANGANGHVKAFSGRDGTLLASFFAYDGFSGNVTIAAADFDNDGTDEIVTVAAVNGHVKVFAANGSAFTAATLPNFANSFFAYEGFIGDVSVTAGDVSGDGRPDIVTVSGAPTAGHIKAFSGQNGALLASFFPLSVTFGVAPPVQIGTVSGVSVADVNADGRFEIVVTPGPGLPARVTAFDLTGAPVGMAFDPFDNFLGGTTVAGVRY